MPCSKWMATLMLLGMFQVTVADVVSYGKYTSTNHVWTVGIPQLDFEYCRSCVENAGLSARKTLDCDIFWYWQSSRTVGQTIRNNTQQTPSCSSYVQPDFKSNTTLTCKFPTDSEHCSYLSTNATHTEGRYHVSAKAPKGTASKLTFELKYCNTSTRNSLNQTLAVTTEYDAASFGVNGTCNCSYGMIFYENGTDYSGIVKCGPFAEWDGCRDAQCWSEPKIQYVLQKNNVSGQKAIFDCEVASGFPQHNKTILLNGTVVSNSRELASSDHNATFCCRADNAYTKKFKLLVSKSGRAIVYYHPEKMVLSKASDVLKMYETGMYNVTFDVNMMPGSQLNVTLRHNSGIPTVLSNYTKDEAVSITYQFNISIKSEEDYGIYNVTAMTSKPFGSAFAILDIRNATKANAVQPAVIAAICASIVLFILAVIGFVIFRKRSLKKTDGETSREDKANELYGMAPPQSLVVNGDDVHNEKQEKSNVLYGTSADVTETVETYAEVNVKKKKKRKGNKNNAFSTEEAAEVTYAAVDRSKKKAPKVSETQEPVYSAVNKK